MWYWKGVANNSNGNIYQKSNQQLNEINNTSDNIKGYKEHRNLVSRGTSWREPQETRLRTWLCRYRTISGPFWGKTIFSVTGLKEDWQKKTDLWFNVRVFSQCCNRRDSHIRLKLQVHNSVMPDSRYIFLVESPLSILLQKLVHRLTQSWDKTLVLLASPQVTLTIFMWCFWNWIAFLNIMEKLISLWCHIL